MPTITAVPNVMATSTTQTGLTTRTLGVAWVNPNNAKVNDGTNVTNPNTADAGYQYLIASDFRVGGVALSSIIDAGASVSKIVLGIDAEGPSFQEFTDLRGRLTGQVFDELSLLTVLSPSEPFYQGANLPSVANVRDPSFGIVLGVQGSGSDAVVDAMYMIITYANPSTAGRRNRSRTTMRAG
jgi:hypothetical protein